MNRRYKQEFAQGAGLALFFGWERALAIIVVLFVSSVTYLAIEEIVTYYREH